jgi:hypothetical protein
MTGALRDPSPKSDRKPLVQGEKEQRFPSETGPLGDFARVLREAGPYLGLGSALAATVGVCFALGFWLDGLMGTKPVLSLVFGSLGVVVALVQFVRTASNVKPRP